MSRKMIHQHTPEWADLSEEERASHMRHNYIYRTENQRAAVDSKYDPMEKIANNWGYDVKEMKKMIEAKKQEAHEKRVQAAARRNGKSSR